MKFDVNKKCNMVYLCGSIDGVSKEVSQNWRMEAYDFLSSIGVVSAVPGLEKIKLTPQQIVALDATMIYLSDAILVNFNFLKANSDKRLGTGSVAELGMGLVQNKIIVGFIDGGELPEHCKFLRGTYDYLFPSMQEALQYIDMINSRT